MFCGLYESLNYLRMQKRFTGETKDASFLPIKCFSVVLWKPVGRVMTDIRQGIQKVDLAVEPVQGGSLQVR